VTLAVIADTIGVVFTTEVLSKGSASITSDQLDSKIKVIQNMLYVISEDCRTPKKLLILFQHFVSLRLYVSKVGRPPCLNDLLLNIIYLAYCQK
jgi:hypothetical protein